ncbi:kinase-like domain-containing protein [Xylaria acuta]|nr:kinase-like domain-containing protein [Xylaria acuta]
MTVARDSGRVKPGHIADVPTNRSTVQRTASHIRKRECVSEHGLMTTLSDNTEDDITSSSNLSDGHLHVASLGSRRNSTSSLSAWSASDPGTQPDFFPKIHGELKIPELESDLVKDEGPRSHLCHTETSVSDPINQAAIRGQGFSVHNIGKPGIQTYAGEATNPGPFSARGLRTKGFTPSIPSPLTGESLQDRLLAERHHYPQGSKGFFLPSKRLESLIQLRNVVEELTRCLRYTTDPHIIQDFAKRICAEEKSYRKVFAILVLIEKADTIPEFLREGIHDGDLPLIKLELGGKPGIFEFGRKPEEGKVAHPLKCFKSFSRMNLMNFEDCQWAVLAPIFDRPRRKDVKHYDLKDQIILPFTEEEEVSEGGFGRIMRVKIHPDHHNFDDSGTYCNQFAIKRLNSHDEQAFWGEFDMLSKFSDDAHPHLISLLAAYTHRKSFYLIFHWARADLVKFWMEIKPKPNIKETVHWVAEQCAELADGLLQIHRYESFRESRNGAAADGTSVGTKLYGRHGDIKPANILWFQNPIDVNDKGTLKLTDFGLAEFHTLHSRSNLSKSRIATSPSYRPPEYDMVEGKISRSYDIWTMGCLYLEFITWLLGGWDLVRLFTIARATPVVTPCLESFDYSFFELVESGKTARVKETVTEFIRVKLHGHNTCTEYLHEFLDLIEEELLLIETGEVNSNKRIECGHLRSKLGSMYQKCVNNPGYAVTPSPRIEESVGIY